MTLRLRIADHFSTIFCHLPWMTMDLIHRCPPKNFFILFPRFHLKDLQPVIFYNYRIAEKAATDYIAKQINKQTHCSGYRLHYSLVYHKLCTWDLRTNVFIRTVGEWGSVTIRHPGVSGYVLKDCYRGFCDWDFGWLSQLSALTHQGNQVRHGLMHWATKNTRVQVFITAFHLGDKKIIKDGKEQVQKGINYLKWFKKR